MADLNHDLRQRDESSYSPFGVTSSGAIALYVILGVFFGGLFIGGILTSARRRRQFAARHKRSSTVSSLPSPYNPSSFHQWRNAGITPERPSRQPWMRSTPNRVEVMRASRGVQGTRTQYHSAWPGSRSGADAEMNDMHPGRRDRDAAVPPAYHKVVTEHHGVAPPEYHEQEADLERDARLPGTAAEGQTEQTNAEQVSTATETRP